MEKQSHPEEEQSLLDLVFDMIDNCDRALKMIGDDPAVREGILLIRDCAVRDLGRLGYRSFPQGGEAFNPHKQEAVGLEGDPQGAFYVVEVQGRGWQKDEEPVRIARVIVGELNLTIASEAAPVNTPKEKEPSTNTPDNISGVGHNNSPKPTSGGKSAESDLSLGEILGGASPGEKARRKRK